MALQNIRSDLHASDCLVGCDINAKNDQGNTSLLCADFTNSTIIKLLIDAGADVEICNANGQRPIQLAVAAKCVESVRLLTDANCSLNIGDCREMKPLRMAVQNGSFEIVKILVENGADLDEDILFYATSIGNEQIVDYLLSRTSLSYTDQWGSSPLFMAVKMLNPEFVGRMIELGASVHQRNDIGNTVLHEAVTEGTSEHVRLLIQYGANVNSQNNSNETPLHEAARKISDDGLETAILLLENGADPNIADIDGATPLFVALESNDSKRVKVFLENGARIDVRNAMGETALHAAAINMIDSKVLERLLEFDIDLDVKNKLDQTPLHCAVAAGNYKGCVSLLGCGATLYDGSDEDAYYSPFVLAMDRIRECATYEFEDNEANGHRKDIINLLLKYIAYLMDRRVKVIENDLELIQDNDETKVYYEKCVKELRDLKREFIHGAISLYNVLDAKTRVIVDYVKNEEFVGKFNNVDKDKFPIYFDLIKDKLDRAVNQIVV